MPRAGRCGEHHQGRAGGLAGAGRGGAAARPDQRLRLVRARRDARGAGGQRAGDRQDGRVRVADARRGV
eukprot:4180336-Alexandrium_andersonii.AAC.1